MGAVSAIQVLCLMRTAWSIVYSRIGSDNTFRPKEGARVSSRAPSERAIKRPLRQAGHLPRLVIGATEPFQLRQLDMRALA